MAFRQVKSQRPEILVGWDAPGEEDLGKPTLDYAKQLLETQIATAALTPGLFVLSW